MTNQFWWLGWQPELFRSFPAIVHPNVPYSAANPGRIRWLRANLRVPTERRAGRAPLRGWVVILEDLDQAAGVPKSLWRGAGLRNNGLYHGVCNGMCMSCMCIYIYIYICNYYIYMYI